MCRVYLIRVWRASGLARINDLLLQGNDLAITCGLKAGLEYRFVD